LRGFVVVLKSFVKIIIIAVLLISVDTLKAASKKGLQPQLAISPSRIEFEPDEVRGTQSVTVLNLGAEPMQVEVSVQNWDFDDDNNYRALPPTPQSLDQWLIINPVRLTIPAKGQQTVRMAIRPKAKPEAGEHRAMVFFKQQRREGAKGVNVQFNVGVPVYAFFGDVRESATLHSMNYSAETQLLSFDISNQGNVYARPQGFFMVVEDSSTEDAELLALLNGKDGEVKGEAIASGKISSKPVFAGERRTVTHSLPVTEPLPQNYTLVIKANIAGESFEKVYRINHDK
jgi:P pilus assembly chaperone PapD